MKCHVQHAASLTQHVAHLLPKHQNPTPPVQKLLEVRVALMKEMTGSDNRSEDPCCPSLFPQIILTRLSKHKAWLNQRRVPGLRHLNLFL